jgi:hypothetical protein
MSDSHAIHSCAEPEVFASVFAEISEKLSRASNWKTNEPASTDELLQLSQSGPSPWHSMMPRLTNGKKENGKKENGKKENGKKEK